MNKIMERPYVIGLDLGGTNAVFGIVDRNANIIAQTDNTSLRQTLQQIRNNDESFQFELFKIAETKGYYKPAAKATVTEVDTVKSELQA